MSKAYACRIKRSNFDAISSENPKFNLEELQAWVDAHDDGYFIRDEEHEAFECQYMDLLVFESIYRFERFKVNEMFHPITLRNTKER